MQPSLGGVQPVMGPDTSTDSTFSLAVWVGTVGGAALSTDPAPNTTAPAANRILRATAKRGGIQTQGTGFLRYITSDTGTSIAVRAWFYDDTQALWIPFGPAVTITVASGNVQGVGPGNMCGAKWFAQITANNGVTALGYDWL